MSAPATDAAVPIGWWRRHAAPLIVLAVAVPALAFVVIGLPIIDDSTAAPAHRPVAQGTNAEVEGYSFTLTKSQEFPGEGTGPGGNDIPVGSSLVAAVIEIEAGASDSPPTNDEGLFCETELSSRSTGAERRWSELSDVAMFGYQIGEGRDDFCSLEGEPLALEVVFLTPEGTYEEATLDLQLGSEDLRFELVH
ncbi:MAG: hypothetical protein H7226_09540 [Salinibacterium sp.]|nr:hypothetical protein [Salinibacterium sp.]